MPTDIIPCAMKKLLIVFSVLILCSSQAFSSDDGKQKERQKYIQKLISVGVFKKIDVSGSVPYLWITPIWKMLDFDQKEISTSVVYTYYKQASDNRIILIIIKDSKTGKTIGKQSDFGLDME